jgi:hypothetical protein
MKRLAKCSIALLLPFILQSAPSIAYEVVLHGGEILSCTQAPSCEGTLCTMRTQNGNLMSERADRIDFEASKTLNEKKKARAPAAKARTPQTVFTFTNRDLAGQDDAMWGKKAKVLRNVDLLSIPRRSEVSGSRQPSRDWVSQEFGYDAVTDDYGRGKEYWRSRAADLERDIDSTRARLELDRKRLAENSRTLLFGKWISEESVEGDQIPTFGILEHPRSPAERALWLRRVEQSNQSVREAEAELEFLEMDRQDLLNEARRSGALTGWLTQP